MATDETPAQPDNEPRHSDPGDPCTHPWCVAVAEANANATPEERESAQRHGVSVKVLRDIRDDARPAAVAGRAGEDDVYRGPAEAAILALGLGPPDDFAITHWADDSGHRATVDAARAPLLAELAELADLAETLRVCEGQRDRRDAELAELAEVARERDEALEVVAQVTHERDGWLADCRKLTSLNKQILDISRQLERERDEARAKAVDGGGWQWGVRTVAPSGDSWDAWHPSEYIARRWASAPKVKEHRTLIRQWLGPVESVTDDGSGT